MYVKSLELTVYIIMKKINPSEWELYNYIKYLYNYNSAHDSWMRDIDSIDTVYDMNSEYILDIYKILYWIVVNPYISGYIPRYVPNKPCQGLTNIYKYLMSSYFFLKKSFKGYSSLLLNILLVYRRYKKNWSIYNLHLCII